MRMMIENTCLHDSFAMYLEGCLQQSLSKFVGGAADDLIIQEIEQMHQLCDFLRLTAL